MVDLAVAIHVSHDGIALSAEKTCPGTHFWQIIAYQIRREKRQKETDVNGVGFVRVIGKIDAVVFTTCCDAEKRLPES